MPLASAFTAHLLSEGSHRIRQNRAAGYAIAIAAVAIATVSRWSIDALVMEGVPFLTYFFAIAVATLLGGLGPGILALVASAILAWWIFIPPEFAFEIAKSELFSLLTFVLMGGFLIILVEALNNALDRALAQEQNVRVLVESSPNGIIVVDKRGVIRTVNVCAEELFGYERVELLGQSIEVLVPTSKTAPHKIERETYQQRPKVRPMSGRELRARRKDGSEFPVEIGLNPVGSNGGVLATVTDIFERKQAQDRQQFLIQELQHRSLNMFAVIQSIANRSLDEGYTRAEAKRILEGRLQALARTHRMLADATWTGAPLSELIIQELNAFSKRVSISGCDLSLNTVGAQMFTLIIHELATNASKYGALSAPDGRVAIECNLERVNGDGIFSLLWRETGGPPVAKPKRKGFGSSILLDGAKQLGRHAELNFERQGLRYEVQLSVSAIAQKPSDPGTVPMRQF